MQFPTTTNRILQSILGEAPAAPEVTQEVDEILQAFATNVVHQWEEHTLGLSVIIPDRIPDEVRKFQDRG